LRSLRGGGSAGVVFASDGVSLVAGGGEFCATIVELEVPVDAIELLLEDGAGVELGMFPPCATDASGFVALALPIVSPEWAQPIAKAATAADDASNAKRPENLFMIRPFVILPSVAESPRQPVCPGRPGRGDIGSREARVPSTRLIARAIGA